MPEKVQVEIDALRKAGDMSRIVFSSFFLLLMPKRKVIECIIGKDYRQEFLETGTFAPYRIIKNSLRSSGAGD